MGYEIKNIFEKDKIMLIGDDTINATGKLYKCKLDESIEGEYTSVAEPKKIVTVKIVR